MDEAHCDVNELSAYLDGELDAVQARRVVSHIAACADCRRALLPLQNLSRDFRALPRLTLGYDLAGVIDGRLDAVAPRPPRQRRGLRRLLPLALGATASLTLGMAMGLALLGGAGVAPPAAILSVFDPLPPGALCPSPALCAFKGVSK